ncbi:MAG: type II/IV secretion system protein [Planctomycetes bacterium]|nr:type II/IV secretion system protein [Planctomycetota bacterium]
MSKEQSSDIRVAMQSARFNVQQCMESLERQGTKIDEHIYEVLTTGSNLSTTDIIQNLLSRTTLHKKQIYRSFADGFSIPFVDMDWILPNMELLPMLAIETWQKHRAFPLSKIGGIMEIAFANPFDTDLIMFFEQKFDLKVSRMYAVPEQIDHYLSIEQVSAHEVQHALSLISGIDVQNMADQLERGDLDSVAPFALQIIKLARKLKASDIHIEPMEGESRIRMRIDGMLRESLSSSNKVISTLVTYFKVCAQLDITEKRLPQDGRISSLTGQADIDMRISSIPTVHGEKMCIRLLDQGVTTLDLESLSFSKRIIPQFKNCLDSPHGLFIVCGPTGSGKTTTLYASLSEISDPSLNITTIEDPVEYSLGGINQIQVHAKIDLGFPQVLRSVLRQDPDIILIGEIRDGETAQIAIKAALTGHLVLSTLHTNTAPEAIIRLIDMGVPAYLVAQALIGIMGQRLVKRLCENCCQPSPLNNKQRETLGIHQDDNHNSHDMQFFDAVGCNDCRLTGYKGRLPVQELLLINENIRNSISNNQNIDKWIHHALEDGYKPLSYDALIKALQGKTTCDEVIRVHTL